MINKLNVDAVIASKKPANNIAKIGMIANYLHSEINSVIDAINATDKKQCDELVALKELCKTFNTQAKVQDEAIKKEIDSNRKNITYQVDTLSKRIDKFEAVIADKTTVNAIAKLDKQLKALTATVKSLEATING